MRALAAVLFDLDETLFDRTNALRDFLADQHHRFVRDLGAPPLAVWQARFLALDARGKAHKAAVYAALLAEFGGRVAADVLLTDYRERFACFARPFDGMVPMLTTLRQRGLRVGIVSNGEADHQARTVAALDLRSLVDAILISGEEGLRKPEAEIFRRAAGRLGVPAERCLFVGDNPAADIAGAAAAGMATAWFRSGEPWPADLVVTPDATIRHLSEVVRLIDDTDVDGAGPSD